MAATWLEFAVNHQVHSSFINQFTRKTRAIIDNY